MSYLLAVKIRLYPTKSQMEQLDRTFGCCRFLYNHMLAEHKDVYARFKHDKPALCAYKYKTEKEYKIQFPFLKEVDSIALQSSREHLQDAYTRFFKNCRDRKAKKTKRFVGLPRFKSKHKGNYSFTTKCTNNNIQIDFLQRTLKLPKFKTPIKYSDPRIFTESIRNVTVSKTKSGKYYASILIQRENSVIPMASVNENKVIAFDMSMKDFLVTKEYKLSNPLFFRKSLHKIVKAHRKVSRSIKRSHNRVKACLNLAKIYERYCNQKKDWMHKIAKKLADTYDVVILEDLNIDGMKRFNKGYAKTVTKDFSWENLPRL